MSRFTIREIDDDDPAIAHVAKNLRESDRREVSALQDRPPQDVLETSVRRSTEAYLGSAQDGEPVAVFGAGVSAVSLTAIPWFLSTPRVEEGTSEFLRQSIRFIRHLRRHARVLENVVHDENEPSKRYLRALGFSFSPVYVLPNGAEYRRFFMSGDL